MDKGKLPAEKHRDVALVKERAALLIKGSHRKTRGSLRAMDIEISRATNALSSPLFDLPDETIVAIMKEAQLTDDEYWSSACDSGNPNRGVYVPILVTASHVSGRLRTVIINNASLWNHINILLSGKGWSPSLLKVYLARSRQLPLSITLREPKERPGRLSSSFAGLKLLLPHTVHWQSLSVIAHSLTCVYTIIGMLQPLSTPILKSLDITWWNTTRLNLANKRILPASILTGGAPSLTFFEVIGIPVIECLPPVHALTSLSIYTTGDCSPRMDPSYFRNILTSASGLCQLSLTNEAISPSFSDDSNQGHPPISLPMIRCIHLYFFSECPAQPLIDFFESLSIPQVNALFLVQSSGGEEDEVALAVMQSISRGAKNSRYPLLKELGLWEFKSACSLTQDLMCSIPSIEILTLERSEESNVLQALATDATLWKDLRYLSLSAVDIEQVCDFVNRRILGGAPLSRLQLREVESQSYPDRVDWLRERLQCQIGYGPTQLDLLIRSQSYTAEIGTGNEFLRVNVA